MYFHLVLIRIVYRILHKTKFYEFILHILDDSLTNQKLLKRGEADYENFNF